MSPSISLLVFLVLATLLVLLTWPDRGILWTLARARKSNERILTEDALKHLFDCEYQDRAASRQSIAGALGIGEHRAVQLLATMEEHELVELRDGTYELTASGRSYALQVIRNHRLWERYFAEETGLHPELWHDEAERLEHRTSTDEADALAAKLGDPRFDPHGDPIPTASGEIAPRDGQSLNELEVGVLAEIVHVEDEPKELYAQLVAENLHPGMRVRVLERKRQRLRFEANAEEIVLAPLLADHLTVRALPHGEEMVGPFERLSALGLDEQAVMQGFLPNCRPAERRRLLDLGLIPGTTVTAELRSPSGDPTGYRIRGAVIALRREQADQIRIETPLSGQGSNNSGSNSSGSSSSGSKSAGAAE